MKKYITGIVLMMAMTLMAQSKPAQAPQWTSWCDSTQRILDLPYYYCPCMEASTEFAFPYEGEVKDTLWFTATMNDLRQGVSAYWFANSSVTMEVYAFCTSKEPTITLTVGPNQMRDIDVAKINKKLDEMGELGAAAQKMTPHIRVFPNNGGSGHVYCYPYDQGPHSTCEEPIPLRPGMTYVCDKEENAYRMESSSIAASGHAFIHWKQKQNKACEIWLTLDSCTGQEIGRAVLSDSLHVYQPDSAMLVEARQANRALWLHAKHEKGYTGRIYYYNNPKYIAPLAPVNKSTCSGKAIYVNLRKYTRSTSFIDTLWVGHDTLRTQQVKLTFTKPELEYDTVYVNPGELSRGYIYQPAEAVLRELGDTILEIKKTNECTRRIQLTLISTEGYEWIETKGKNCKIIQNGQLFIYIDERKYNVLGQEIKNIN